MKLRLRAAHRNKVPTIEETEQRARADTGMYDLFADWLPGVFAVALLGAVLLAVWEVLR